MARNVAWQVLIRASKVTINSWNVRNRQKLIQKSVCLKRSQGPGQEASAFQVKLCFWVLSDLSCHWQHTKSDICLIVMRLRGDTWPTQIDACCVIKQRKLPEAQPVQDTTEVALQKLPSRETNAKQWSYRAGPDFEWSCLIKKTPLLSLLMFTEILDPTGWSSVEPGSPRLVILFACVLASRLLRFMLLYTCAYVCVYWRVVSESLSE